MTTRTYLLAAIPTLGLLTMLASWARFGLEAMLR
jgi:hypothetical protein